MSIRVVENCNESRKTRASFSRASDVINCKELKAGNAESAVEMSASSENVRPTRLAL